MCYYGQSISVASIATRCERNVPLGVIKTLFISAHVNEAQVEEGQECTAVSRKFHRVAEKSDDSCATFYKKNNMFKTSPLYWRFKKSETKKETRGTSGTCALAIQEPGLVLPWPFTTHWFYHYEVFLHTASTVKSNKNVNMHYIYPQIRLIFSVTVVIFKDKCPKNNPGTMHGRVY